MSDSLTSVKDDDGDEIRVGTADLMHFRSRCVFPSDTLVECVEDGRHCAVLLDPVQLRALHVVISRRLAEIAQ